MIFQDFDDVEPIVIYARSYSACPACREWIEEGDAIAYSEDEGAFTHEECAE